MVEGCRHLNQRLELALLRFIECEPDLFPMLVSSKKLAPFVAGESFGKRTAIPIKRHAFSLFDFVADAGELL